MTNRTCAQWVAAAAGVILLALPACSTKMLSGGAESEFPSGESPTANAGREPASSVASDAGLDSGLESELSTTNADGSPFSSGPSPYDQDHNIPRLSMEGASGSEVGSSPDGGALSGLDRLALGDTPSEERITEGTISSRMLSSDASDKRMAELRREEEAAITAGFQDAFFGFDQTSIEGATREALSSNAVWIKSHPEARVKVSGHCDERGTHDYNLVLGDKRAKAVKRYLVDLGVSPAQIRTVSFGKNRPFCAEHDESCYRQNRRGHFLLSSK